MVGLEKIERRREMTKGMTAETTEKMAKAGESSYVLSALYLQSSAKEYLRQQEDG